MNKRKLLSIVLALVVLVSLMQPTYAKTKYTKTEKKLAETIACFQEDNLIDPDSFRIRRIHRVKYKLDKDVYFIYEAYGLLKDSNRAVSINGGLTKKSEGERNQSLLNKYYCLFLFIDRIVTII